jgi:putative transposase
VSAFIDAHRDRFGVEPICRTLGVSESAYYQRRSAPPSKRQRDDELLLDGIRLVHQRNWFAYGARRVWLSLRRDGVEVGRDRVRRLMRQEGLAGAKRRGKRWRTTISDPAQPRPADLVARNFVVARPDALWVADFTYLRSWQGVSYFSFVLDAYSRRIVGWQLTTHMRTSLVLDALRMALTRRQQGADVELVHHSDAGSQGGFKWSSQHPDGGGGCGQAGGVDAGVDGQVGDEVAGGAVVAAGGGARVLAADRDGRDERGGGRGGGRVAGGWQPMVSRSWRDVAVWVGPAVGEVSVVC